MSYMHQTKGIIHRDLKPDNILVGQDLNLVIGDFGQAQPYDSSRLLNTRAGTSVYLAPEIHQNQKYDGKKADIFALGMVLFITVVGFFPFHSAKNDDEFYKLMMSNNSKLFW